jgi:hypothetical protein
MIEVQLRPGVSGCVTGPLGCLSLGLVPLLIRSGERHMAKQMDDAGIETRGGTRIAWNEFTSVRRVQGRMKGNTLSDEYILTSPKCRVSVPIWRTINAEEVRAFTLSHVPPNLLSETR